MKIANGETKAVGSESALSNDPAKIIPIKTINPPANPPTIPANMR